MTAALASAVIDERPCRPGWIGDRMQQDFGNGRRRCREPSAPIEEAPIRAPWISIRLSPAPLLLPALILAAAGLAAAASQQPPAAEAPASPAPSPPPAIIWNDWGPDVFKRATAENRPVLLYVRTAWSRGSIWNEEKIWTDPEVMRLVAEKWIPVRVERDRRPDIDQRYQIAVQAVSKGEGGWPLTALLFDTGEALAGRAYVPLEDRMGRPGLRSLLEKTAGYFADNRERVVNLRALVMISFDRERENHRRPEIAPALVDEVVAGMMEAFDRENGGFGPPPRLLMPYPLELAATQYHRTGDPAMLDVLVRTLSGMERGAIHDRVGGGFHRSTGDPTWRYPEFEKLLNYNAALLPGYLLGYQATGDPDFRNAASGIVDYLLTLADPAGGFYVAQWAASRADAPRADYYAVTPEEFAKAIPAGGEIVARALFNISSEGEMVIGPPPRGLLYLTMSRKEASERLGVPLDQVRSVASGIAAAIGRSRAAREAPPLEKAIYVDSCASAAAALFEAHRALGRRDALDAARAALDRMIAAIPVSGPLLHRVQPSPEAGVDPPLAMDHMMLARAALAGYEATGAGKYLQAARDLVDRAVALFWDPNEGGFFDIAADPAAVGFMSVRRRLPNDTAYPSLNSLAARVLQRLSLLTGEPSHLALAEKSLKGLIAATASLNQHDAGLALAVESLTRPPARYVVVAAAGDPRGDELFEAAGRLFDPGKIVVRLEPGRDDDELGRLKLDRKGRQAYAVRCRADRCSDPATDETSLKRLAAARP